MIDDESRASDEIIFKELEEARSEWEKERDTVIGDLTNLLIHKAFDHDIIERAIKFIKDGEI